MDERYLEAIANQLTGNIDEDFIFIIKEVTHLQKLGLPEMASEILRLFEAKYGDEGKNFLINKAKENQKRRKEDFQKALDLLKEKKFLDAQNIIVKLIDTFPIARKLNDNEVLKSFPHVIEHLYYNEYLAKGKVVIKLEEPLSSYYFHLAFCLFSQQDYEEALIQLDNCLKYNDVSPDAYLLKANCYLFMKDIVKFKFNLKMAFEYAFSKYQLANGYMQLCNHYMHQKDKLKAYAAFYASLFYSQANNPEIVIAKLEELEGESLKENETERIKEILKEDGFSIGPSKSMFNLLDGIVNHPKTSDNPNAKILFLNSLYELTRNQKYQKMIVELQIQMKNKKNDS